MCQSQKTEALYNVAIPKARYEVAPWRDFYSVDHPRARLVADEHSVLERRFVPDRLESRDVARAGVARRLRLYRRLSANDEVHLKTGSRAPVGDFRADAASVRERRDFVQNPALEGVPVFGRPAFDGLPALQLSGEARVEEVELRRLDSLTGLAFAPDGHFAREKGVFENLEVFLNRAARDLRVHGDRLVVDLLPARKGGDFEKAAEGGQISRRALLHDFLLEIERDVARKILLGCVREPDAGQKASVESLVEVESVAEFGGGEGVDVSDACSAAEEIDPALAQLSGAGACEQKPQSLGLDEAVDFIEKRGEFLDFVDYDRPRRVLADFFDISWRAGEKSECVIGEQVEDIRLGDRLADERRLAALPRAEEEARLLREYGRNIEFSGDIHGFLSNKGKECENCSINPPARQSQIANSTGDLTAKSPTDLAICNLSCRASRHTTENSRSPALRLAAPHRARAFNRRFQLHTENTKESKGAILCNR